MNPALPWIIPLGCVLLLTRTAECFILPNSSHLESILSKYQDGEAHSRSKRAILFSDRQEILMLHNKLRGQVYPVASNMEYMVSLEPDTSLYYYFFYYFLPNCILIFLVLQEV